MQFSTFVPKTKFNDLIECYWTVIGDVQDWMKITPDGYPEIIFHFGDPYRVKFWDGSEIIQPAILLAGQIDRPLHLKPLENSDVVGIKLKPTGLWKLLRSNVSVLTNQTVGIDHYQTPLNDGIHNLHSNLSLIHPNERIHLIDSWLDTLSIQETETVDNEVGTIIRKKGNIFIQDLHTHLSPRKLQRYFLEQVGVSAKTFAKIIRFAQIYKMLQNDSLSKIDTTFLLGYSDQSHFNKDFRQFTGENPKQYFGSDHSFSNFFLQR